MSTPLIASRRRSGFTLIEVAVALALFVFGALAIVRIFPPALGVIRNNEDRSTATQLGQSTLAQLSGKGSAAPDAIYDGDATTWNDVDASVVGTATKNNSVPKGVTDTDFQNSALNSFKYIVGEKHVALTGGYALLKYSAMGTPTAYQEYDIEGVTINASGLLDFSNAKFAHTETAFNSSTQSSRPADAYRMDQNTTYYVSYRWLDAGTGYINGVIDEPINIPRDADWNGDSARVAYSFIDNANRILPGGVKVRMKILVSPLPTFEPTRGLVTGLTAGAKYSFDYTVADWRWLVYDGSPQREDPTSTDYVSTLPVRGIADPPYYGLLITASASPNASPTITIDSKTGKATYNIGVSGDPTVWARTRTVYQTLDEWANQLSVAAKSYVPFYTDAQLGNPRANTTAPLSRPLLPSEAWREYYWSSGDKTNIYFHVGDAGKTVEVSFTDSDTNQVVNSVCTIGDDQLDASVIGVNAAAFAPSGKVSRLQITDATGTTVSASSILSVQGLSVQARTAWINNDRYNQVLVPGYRTLTN